jgi:hypothetical protein
MPGIGDGSDIMLAPRLIGGRVHVVAAMTAVALSAGIAGAPGEAAAQSFRPFDEGPRDRSFAAFRRKLIRIVDARDLAALRRHFHPDIRTSFGGQNGRAEAAKAMQDDKARWRTLARILRRGGRFMRTKWQCRTGGGAKPCILPGFIAPYTYYATPPKGRDAFETMVITGTRVNVRAAPRRTAKVVARLSHRIVTVPKKPRKNTPSDWVEIELPRGRTGFVFRQFAVSPIDYRAGFVKEAGRWQMTFFLAGD